MGISLGAVEAWSVQEQLPPDTYLFAPATDGVERDTINDSEKIKVNWRVAAGPYTGAERGDWITVSERAMGRVKQLIVAAGIKEPAEDFDSYKAVADWLAEELRKPGFCVAGVVRLKDDRQGRTNDDGSVKQWPEIVGYVSAKEAGITATPAAAGASSNGAAAKKDDLPFRAEPVPSFVELKAHEARSL